MKPIAYIGLDPNGSLQAYCEADALRFLFAGRVDLFESAKQNSGTDIRGNCFGLITEDTVYGDRYLVELLSLEGVYCTACCVELYPPVELPF